MYKYTHNSSHHHYPLLPLPLLAMLSQPGITEQRQRRLYWKDKWTTIPPLPPATRPNYPPVLTLRPCYLVMTWTAGPPSSSDYPMHRITGSSLRRSIARLQRGHSLMDCKCWIIMIMWCTWIVALQYMYVVCHCRFLLCIVLGYCVCVYVCVWRGE